MQLCSELKTAAAALRCCSRSASSSSPSSSPSSPISVLGIESSCDDTGVAVVRSDGTILSNILYSQTKEHLLTGGIIPSAAAQLHAARLPSAIDEAMEVSRLLPRQLAAVAVTTRPGLAPCLKIGMEAAKSFARKHNVALIPIHHMQAHALTACLTNEVKLPILCLLLSGGHALLAAAKSIESFALIGRGLDQSPGDTLDKCARLLKLRLIPKFNNCHGGAAIEIMARNGNPFAYQLYASRNRKSDCNMSFSGLNSRFHSVAYKLLNDYENDLSPNGELMQNIIPNLCASLQYALIKLITTSLCRGIKFARIYQLLPNDFTLAISGGVAANQILRQAIRNVAHFYEIKCVFPPPKLCTDNGVMIAWNAIMQINSLPNNLYLPNQLHLVDLQPKSPIGEDLSHIVKDWHIPVDKFSIL